MNKQNKKIHRHRKQHSGYPKGNRQGQVEEGKESQIYSDRRRLDFG